MGSRAEYERERRRKLKGSYCMACHLLIHYEDGTYRCALDGSLKDKMDPACRQRVKGRMRSHRAYYLEKMKEQKGGDGGNENRGSTNQVSQEV